MRVSQRGASGEFIGVRAVRWERFDSSGGDGAESAPRTPAERGGGAPYVSHPASVAQATASESTCDRRSLRHSAEIIAQLVGRLSSRAGRFCHHKCWIAPISGQVPGFGSLLCEILKIIH